MYKELIERLRAGSGGMKHWQELESEAADAIEELQATATEYQQAADKMAWEHKVERDKLNDDVSMHMRVAVRAIDECVDLKVERDTLRQQLAEAQALIEASRKQKAVAYLEMKYEGGHEYLAETFEGAFNSFPVYAAPVVASDVQRDADRYRWLREASNTTPCHAPTATLQSGAGLQVRYETYGDRFKPCVVWRTEALDQAIDAAMKGAA